MTRDQFIALFPLKATITQEIIDKANIMDEYNCIGALTLKSVIPDTYDFHHKLAWGCDCGLQGIYKKPVLLTTLEGINMMNVKTPQEVTFVVVP